MAGIIKEEIDEHKRKYNEFMRKLEFENEIEKEKKVSTSIKYNYNSTLNLILIIMYIYNLLRILIYIVN